MNVSSLITVHAGNLSACWEPGGLRYIRYGERELIRRIYGAVRDERWGTVPGEISETSNDRQGDVFRIAFTSTHREEAIDFAWRGTVTGTAGGEIRFEFDGEAKSTFRRNRIGLCALHPASCGGAATRQTRTDGRIIESHFSKLIEPQVIGSYTHRQLQALSHEVCPGVWCELTFEGEIFETEDQRNWTDASFKTYGTPLELPFPVEIAAGTRVRQSVSVRVTTNSARPIDITTRERDGVIGIELGPIPDRASAPPLPEIGIAIPMDGPPPKEGELAELAAAGFAHARIDLNLSEARWEETLKRALRGAAGSLNLEVAALLPAGDTDEALRRLRHRARDGIDSIERLIIYREGETTTRSDTMMAARRILGGLNKPLGSGAQGNFCELNLAQHLGEAALAESDFICWPVNPQMHAADELTMAENAAGIASTIETARAFCGEKSLLISPLTLKPRPTSAEVVPSSSDLPRSVDPRQRSLFAASWTIAALKSIFEAPIHSATAYETSGWRGLRERSSGSRLPQHFPSHPGEYFPLYYVLADLAGFSWRGREVRSRSTRPSEVEALAVAWKDALLVFVGNMTDTTQRVRIRGLPSNDPVRFHRFDETNRKLVRPENWHLHEREFAVENFAPENLKVELTLPPYAFGRLAAPIEY